MSIHKKSIVALALFAAFAGQALAVTGTPAVTPDGTSPYDGDGPWTLGYSFVANTPLAAVGLGAYDAGHDGFTTNHEVGLWDSMGNLLATTTVTSAGTLIGDFRYAAISAVSLNAGSTYYVGASDFGAGETYTLYGNVTAAAGITYSNSAFMLGAGLLFPSNAGPVNGYYGGNVLLAAVPEPETYAMLIGGLALLGAMRRRQRNQHS